MNLKEAIKDYIARFIGINNLTNRVTESLETQEKILARISEIDNRLTENTRALATLAIVQASLVREISEYIESKEKPKYKKAQPRNTGSDFTN